MRVRIITATSINNSGMCFVSGRKYFAAFTITQLPGNLTARSSTPTSCQLPLSGFIPGDEFDGGVSGCVCTLPVRRSMRTTPEGTDPHGRLTGWIYYTRTAEHVCHGYVNYLAVDGTTLYFAQA